MNKQLTQRYAPPVTRVQQPVLQVKDLHVQYHTDRGVVNAVNGVTFDLQPGERLGLIGESGSGKSTMALALMRMIKPPGRVTNGQLLLNGDDLLQLSPDEMRQARSRRISMIPQGAMNSLNPVTRIREQIMDTMIDHDQGLNRRELEARMNQVLESVGLRPSVAKMYPHELSGGMKQRVCIAIAITMQPDLIIADEPTSALDVVVQRQIMETLERLQQEMGVAVILIGHDMGLMAQFVDRLAVMYAGKLAELSPIRDMFREPLHPYSQLLISSLPQLENRGTFQGIPGLPPSLKELPSGCLFHPRCPYVMDICKQHVPAFVQSRPNRWAACHLVEGRHDTAD